MPSPIDRFVRSKFFAVIAAMIIGWTLASAWQFKEITLKHPSISDSDRDLLRQAQEINQGMNEIIVISKRTERKQDSFKLSLNMQRAAMGGIDNRLKEAESDIRAMQDLLNRITPLDAEDD